MIRTFCTSIAIAIAIAFTALPAPAFAQPAETFDFPAAERGAQRVVIRLAPRRDEQLWKVEFYAGRQKEIDCNRQGYGQNLIERKTPIGYSYWTVNGDARAFSTMMGCPPNSRRMAFVSGTSVLENYNSRLPIIVFVPPGMELRYRMWNVVTREMIARPE
jgi:ecotin